MPRLSILIPTKGRPTLENTLASVAHQVVPGDEVLVEVNDDAPWGHRARQRLIPRAQGDVLLFIDDDDVYTAGALEAIRAAVREHPERVHIFRMRYHKPERPPLWKEPEVKLGNVSTGMLVVPNRSELLGTWDTDEYAADFAFLTQTVEKAGDPIWHEEVVLSAGYAQDARRGSP